MKWVEAALQDAMSARIGATEPPRTANCTEADVVRDIVGEKALGD